MLSYLMDCFSKMSLVPGMLGSVTVVNISLIHVFQIHFTSLHSYGI